MKALCVECGKEFEQTRKSHKLCSPECKKIWTARYKRELFKSQGRNAVEKPCSLCGKLYMPSKKNRLLCSDECKKKKLEYWAEHKKEFNKTEEAKKNHQEYEKTEKCKAYRKGYQQKRRQDPSHKEYMRKIEKSEKVQNSRKVYRGTENYRLLVKKAGHIRRAKIRGLKVGKIDFNWINERDGFRCQLCKKKMNMNLKYPHLMSPSYDHIITVSDNGETSNRNFQLTHLRCNLQKNRKTPNIAQMYLL